MEIGRYKFKINSGNLTDRITVTTIASSKEAGLENVLKSYPHVPKSIISLESYVLLYRGADIESGKLQGNKD